MPDSGEYIRKKGNKRRVRPGRKDKPYETNIWDTLSGHNMAWVGYREQILNRTLGRLAMYVADHSAWDSYGICSLAGA